MAKKLTPLQRVTRVWSDTVSCILEFRKQGLDESNLHCAADFLKDAVNEMRKKEGLQSL